MYKLKPGRQEEHITCFTALMNGFGCRSLEICL